MPNFPLLPLTAIVLVGAATLLGPSPATLRAEPPPTAMPSPGASPSGRGIPGARDVDHVGLTVPDLDQATRFFVDVLGADLLWTDGPSSDPQGDTMAKKFAVDPRASLRLAMLRLGPNCNVELMEYHAPGQNTQMPVNSDVDVPHLAFYVDDVDQAGKYLEAHGCVLLGGPNVTPDDNPRAGQVMRYAVTPWRLTIELVHRPAHMPYERRTDARLYGPAPAWK